MSDEQAESSAATENAEVEASSAETENTEKATAEASEPRVPHTRFNEVVYERNELREKAKALEDRLAALESTPADTEEELDAQTAEAKKLVERFAGAMMQKELGMSLKEVKERLARADSAGKTAQELQWEAACSRYGLDSSDKKVKALARGLSLEDSSLKTTEDLMAAVKSVFATTTKTSTNGKTAGASVETRGVGAVMQSSDWVPKDKKDAAAGALKGKKSKHISSVEAIQRRAKG